TGFIMEFGGKGTAADPGAISFGNTKHFPDFLRRNTQSRTNTGGYGVGRCHKRKGAEVYIQHTALRAFREHFFSLTDLFIDEIFTVYNLQLTHKIKSLEKLFFPGGDIFMKPE